MTLQLLWPPAHLPAPLPTSNCPSSAPRPHRGSRTYSCSQTAHMPIHPAPFSTPLPQDGFSFCCFFTRRGGQGRKLGCVTARKDFRTFTSIKQVLPRDEQTHICLLTEINTRWFPVSTMWVTLDTEKCTRALVMQRFPGGSGVMNLPASAGEPSLIPGLGRAPGEGNDNPLRYSCLGNPTDCSSPWGCKESDTTEQLNSPSCNGCSANMYEEEGRRRERRK